MSERQLPESSSLGEVLDNFDPDPSDSIETIRVTPEAPWDEAGESLLREWLASSKQQSCLHRKRGYKLKQLYKFLGILSIVTAATVFFCSNVEIPPDEKTESIIRVFVAFVNLIIANLSSFLSYGPKYQRQFEFEGKYIKVAIDLKEILATVPDFRPPKDKTLAEYKEKVGNLFVNAPEA